MGLTQKDEEKIQNLFREAVTAGKYYAKDKYKQTEKRLYAYPVLQRNINRYKLDIEDVKQESFGKSQDFVIYCKNSGDSSTPSLEELREAKVLVIERKIARDEKEIVEINAALEEIQADEYYKIITMLYFQGIKGDDIAEALHCDRATIYRNRKRLINTLSISLYGADALR